MATGGTVGMLDQIFGGLERVHQAADTAAEKLRESAAAAEESASRITAAVDTAGERVATRADDVAFQFQRMADEGDNAWARLAEGIIRQVQEGMTDSLAAINAFGDGVTVIDGKLQSVRDVLSQVLPNMGETQVRIREMVAALKAEGAGVEEITRRLAQQHNSYAKDLAELVRLMRSGKITIDEVLRRAQELQRAFPGSETSALSELLAEELRDDRRRRG